MELLKIAQAYFQDKIAHQATELDQDPETLKKALKGMGELGLLALQVPEKWGGSGLSELNFRQFQVMSARYSGALAFLQTQHQSAASQLAASNNESLKKTYLPGMKRGEVLIGIGFSHLRRQGEPIMKANPVKGGYLLSGIVPWITGFNFFDSFILGATLPDGKALYGLLPFQEKEQALGGKIRFSEPMQLMGMLATNTVKGQLDQWFLSEGEVVEIKASDAIHKSDRKNVLTHGFFALGCAYAGVDILERTYQKKQFSFIEKGFKSLKGEVRSCKEAMLESVSGEGREYQYRLQLRGWAINLAQRCANAAIAVSSGAANELSHDAGRVYREALVFSVSGQTVDVMEATLNNLLSGPPLVYSGDTVSNDHGACRADVVQW